MPVSRWTLPKAFLVLLVASAPAPAGCRPETDDPDEQRVGDLHIGEVLIAESLTGDRAAVYFTVTNRGDGKEEILEASVEGASRSSLHRSQEVDGVMTMRPVAGIVIPPGETVQLLPGGYHVMLEQLSREFKAGDTLSGVVLFREQGPRKVSARVVSYDQLDRAFAGKRSDSEGH
jgi:copper(I)-binding protein